MVKPPHSVLMFFVCINVAKFAISVWIFSRHCVVKFTIVYSTNYKTVWKSIVWELLLYSVCRILPHANMDRWDINTQSARKKSNYHTKCGKNCHKILSVQSRLTRVHEWCTCSDVPDTLSQTKRCNVSAVQYDLDSTEEFYELADLNDDQELCVHHETVK